MSTDTQIDTQIEHIFRHEYGRLVALLTRRFGVQHLDAIEDSVQWALMQALDVWSRSDLPDNPSAWLYQVAYRHLISEIRTSQRRHALLEEHSTSDQEASTDELQVPLPGELSDSLLRMLFITCDQSLAIESQLVFTLKSLCGFSIDEISQRLFTTKANIYKRFGRAKNHLKNQTLNLETLTSHDMAKRLTSVHYVLYLVFTEGYLSSHPDNAIRQDLCEEAIRLVKLLIESKVGDQPESYALVALMYFHLSRMNTRQNDTGSLLLLEHQDRTQWNKQQIALGLHYLQLSAQGDKISRYHIEASIAVDHCLSPSFEQTPWQKIADSYELLERVTISPLHRLNRAIATAEWKGPKAGLAVLQSMEIPNWLEKSYLWNAVMADLLFRCGEVNLATPSAKDALNDAPSTSIRELLNKRWGKIGLTLDS